VTSSNAADSQHLTDTGINGTSEVRTYIWEGSLHLIAHNPILGYGPETMIYVYSPYYPSGLGHIEHANAAPDRNHDEWLDFVVFSGVIGLLAWLLVLAAFAYTGIVALRRARSRRSIVVLAAIAAVVVGHLAEASVGIDIVSTLMLLWTMFALTAVFYLRPELLGAATPAMEAAGDVPLGVPVAADAEAVRTPVGAATGSRGNGARGRASERVTGRGGNGRPPRGQARVAAPPVRTPGFERLNGAQQGWLAVLIVLALIATVGGAYLFGTNVQVVRADAFYKQGQSYDNVGAACLAAARNQPGGDACIFSQQYQGAQLANVAGQDLIPTALNYYQQATAAQPKQDMYYLWTGKTYLDEAQYYLAVNKKPDAFTQFSNAEQALLTARSLNPYNADHPMNLGRMYHGWAAYDPSKWPLADKYFKIATALALHNGRWWDEWGNADMDQAAHRPGLTAAQRTTLYRNALAEFQHACQVDDLLGDARVFRGMAYAALGMNKEAAASYAEALKVGGFETFAATGPSPVSAAVLENLITALATAHEYKALVQPTTALLPAAERSAAPSYLGQSPMTLAYSPSLGISTSAFSSTLQSISSTLRLKGLVK
jgi:tetratricopeptide (TPR) repeat protein